MSLELLTTDEVAKLLRVSSETVCRLAASGELHGRKVGRAWRFPRQAVEDYFRREANKEVSPSVGNPGTTETPRERAAGDHRLSAPPARGSEP